MGIKGAKIKRFLKDGTGASFDVGTVEGDWNSWMLVDVQFTVETKPHTAMATQFDFDKEGFLRTVKLFHPEYRCEPTVIRVDRLFSFRIRATVLYGQSYLPNTCIENPITGMYRKLEKQENASPLQTEYQADKEEDFWRRVVSGS